MVIHGTVTLGNEKEIWSLHLLPSLFVYFFFCLVNMTKKPGVPSQSMESMYREAGGKDAKVGL